MEDTNPGGTGEWEVLEIGGTPAFPADLAKSTRAEIEAVVQPKSVETLGYFNSWDGPNMLTAALVGCTQHDIQYTTFPDFG